MNTTRWRLLSQLAERAAGQDQPQRLAYGSLEYTDARNGSLRSGTVHRGPGAQRVHTVPHVLPCRGVVGGHDQRHAPLRLGIQLLPEVPSERPHRRHRRPAGAVSAACSSIRSVQIYRHRHIQIDRLMLMHRWYGSDRMAYIILIFFSCCVQFQGLHLLRSPPRAAKLR
jgi:hypothetical protein